MLAPKAHQEDFVRFLPIIVEDGDKKYRALPEVVRVAGDANGKSGKVRVWPDIEIGDRNCFLAGLGFSRSLEKIAGVAQSLARDRK